MTQAMVDLETMGNGPNAAIIAIGAVAFDSEKGVHDGKFYRIVDLASAVQNGGEITPSTVLWWMGQSEAARNEFKRKGETIKSALLDFSAWCSNNSIEEVWGNGATFDNVILRSAYDRAGIAAPWKYNKDRCYRTVKALYPEVSIPNVGVAHNAVNDAEYQALCLIKMLNQGEVK